MNFVFKERHISLDMTLGAVGLMIIYCENPEFGQFLGSFSLNSPAIRLIRPHTKSSRKLSGFSRCHSLSPTDSQVLNINKQAPGCIRILHIDVIKLLHGQLPDIHFISCYEGNSCAHSFGIYSQICGFAGQFCDRMIIICNYPQRGILLTGSQ